MVKWLFMWTVVDPGILEPGVAVQARYNFLGLEMALIPLYTYPTFL